MSCTPRLRNRTLPGAPRIHPCSLPSHCPPPRITVMLTLNDMDSFCLVSYLVYNWNCTVCTLASDFFLQPSFYRGGFIHFATDVHLSVNFAANLFLGSPKSMMAHLQKRCRAAQGPFCIYLVFTFPSPKFSLVLYSILVTCKGVYNLSQVPCGLIRLENN